MLRDRRAVERKTESLRPVLSRDQYSRAFPGGERDVPLAVREAVVPRHRAVHVDSLRAASRARFRLRLRLGSNLKCADLFDFHFGCPVFMKKPLCKSTGRQMTWTD